jgi:multidrug transporter EmrE-like cation transporter
VERKTKGFLLVIFSVVVVVVGQLILKSGLSKVNEDFSMGILNGFVQIFSNWIVWVALILLALNGITWIIGLSKVPLSYAYPVLSIGYVLVSILSWLLLNENLSLLRIFGLGFVVVGVVMLSRT